MAHKDEMEQILKRLESGSDEIYKRYEKMIAESRAHFAKNRKALEAEYTRSANEAAARARVDLDRNLERMADSGVVRSGETVHAAIAANADRNRALAQLSEQKAKDLTELSAVQAEKEAALSKEAWEQARSLTETQAELAQNQKNADREYALKKEELEWKKETASDRSGTSSGKENGESALLEPKKSPYDYLEDIVEKNTRYQKNQGYRVLNRKAVNEALNRLVHDEKLSVSYRYELYLYAQSMGYLN